jgi:ribosome biogenesis protein Tsr3
MAITLFVISNYFRVKWGSARYSVKLSVNSPFMKVSVKFISPYDSSNPLICTAANLVHKKVIREVEKIPGGSIVLYPFAEKELERKDGEARDSIVAIDAPWHLIKDTVPNMQNANYLRRLPYWEAQNPYYRNQKGKYSSAEAIALALVILGEEKLAYDVIRHFYYVDDFYNKLVPNVQRHVEVFQ